jgi:hypothetical protein
MKKIIVIFLAFVCEIVCAQSLKGNTADINNIIETFKSIDGMILTETSLNQFYNDISKISYAKSVLFKEDDYYNVDTYSATYGDNNIFKKTNFLNKRIDNFVKVSTNVSSANNDSPYDYKQVDVSILFRNESGDLIQDFLIIQIYFGKITVLSLLENAPMENTNNSIFYNFLSYD